MKLKQIFIEAVKWFKDVELLDDNVTFTHNGLRIYLRYNDTFNNFKLRYGNAMDKPLNFDTLEDCVDFIML